MNEVIENYIHYQAVVPGGKKYTAIPSEEFDITRLLIERNPEFFIGTDSFGDKKQKTIVLCDWSASDWEESLLESVKKNLELLLKKGLVIYVSSDREELKQLTLENIYELDSSELREKILPSTRDELAKILSKKNIAIDHVAFFSYQTIRKFFTPEKSEAVFYSDIRSVIERLISTKPFDETIKKVIFSLQSFKENALPILIKNNIYGISEKIKAFKKSVMLHCKGIVFEDSYNSLELCLFSSDDDLELAPEIYRSIKKITVKENGSEPFKKISKERNETTEKKLIRKNNQFDQLTFLSLKSETGYQPNYALLLQSVGSFDFLTLLEINLVHISPNFLENFLSSAKNLTCLIFYPENSDDFFKVFQKIDLKNLKELRVDLSRFSDLSPKNLIAFLRSISHVEKLTLGGLTLELGEFITLDGPIVFPNLKQLNLSASEVYLQELYNLCGNMPFIQKINLHLVNIIETLKEEENELPVCHSLKEIHIENSQFNAYGISFFVTIFPDIKKLILKSSQINWNDKGSFYSMDFSKDWDEFDLSNSRIDRLALSHLLQSFYTNGKVLRADSIEVNKGDESFSLEEICKIDKVIRINFEKFGCYKSNKQPLATSSIFPLEGSFKLIDHPIEENLTQNLLEEISLPPHSVESCLDKEAADPHVDFYYEGDNDSFNQDMIFEKLCQYITLFIPDKKSLIPKILKGICNALCHLFLDKTEEAGEEFLMSIHRWDGKKESIEHNDELKMHFDCLLKYVEKYQLDVNFPDNQLIGDGLNNFLGELVRHPGKKWVLSNPWHTTVVSYENEQWRYYDPNFLTGRFKTVETLSQLESMIEHILGSFIFVENYPKKINCVLNSVSCFIGEGGLLAFSYLKDSVALLNWITMHTDLTEFTEKQLSLGLCVRNNRGVPVWLVALRIPSLQNYIFQLIQHYQTLNKNYIDAVKKSMSALSFADYERYYNTFKSLKFLCHDKIFTQLENIFLQRAKLSFFDQAPKKNSSVKKQPKRKKFILGLDTAFKSWLTSLPKYSTAEAYWSNILTDPKSERTLVKCQSNRELEEIFVELIAFCHTTGRPFYPVHSAHDLVCSADYLSINPDDLSCEVKPGPGGKLHDFLKKHQSDAVVLIVNYSRFSKKEMVQFNALLNNPGGHADGTELPAKRAIVGFLDVSDPKSYKGEDFFSRFLLKVDRSSIPKITVPTKSAVVTTTTTAPKIEIDLYESFVLWQKIFKGGCELVGTHFSFVQSAFVSILERVQKEGIYQIVLKNRPNDSEFSLFLKQAEITGKMNTLVGDLTLPPDLVFSTSRGYSGKKLLDHLVDDTVSFDPTIKTFILNSQTFSRFMARYHLDEIGHYYPEPGILAEYAGKKLCLYLTNPLGIAEESRFLTACEENKIHLEIKKQFPTLSKNVHLSLSNDIDYVVENWLNQFNRKLRVVDISEFTFQQLFSSLSFKDPNKKDLIFKTREGVVLSWLKKGENVLLKGNFSQEFIDKIAELMLDFPYLGQLILVANSSQKNQFSFCKENAMEITNVQLLEPFVVTQSKAKLQEATKSKTHFWDGLRSLALDPLIEAMQRNSNILINFEEAESIADAFDRERMAQIESSLLHYPYTFISGVSGVGKSTFVKKYVDKKEQHHVFYGKDQLLNWARSLADPNNPDKKQILFIDEANITESDWSIFDGLFYNPPGLIIGDDFIPINTQTHKIIFAGNPLSYGGQRKLPALFDRRGNAIIFKMMPLEYIYQRILLPIFKTKEDGLLLGKEEVHEISRIILRMYRYLCSISTETLLISPREAETMALSAINAAKYQGLSGDKLLKKVAYDTYCLGKTLVDEKHRVEFESEFKSYSDFVDDTIQKDVYFSEHFILTDSRRPLVKALTDLLSIRENIKCLADCANDEQRYGGLGGFILEGEPGTGKSEAITALLKHQGYRERKFESNLSRTSSILNNISSTLTASSTSTTTTSTTSNTSPAIGEKIFYRIPNSWSFNHKKACLLQAFHEGAVVVIDEINGNEMMEELLNDLLMGYGPNKERPQRPGFLLIGTQNPNDREGRSEESIAIQRRVWKEKVPLYTRNEMLEILDKKGCDSIIAEAVVDQYLRDFVYAKANNHIPPTFREVCDFVKPYCRTSLSVAKSSFTLQDKNVFDLAKDGFFGEPKLLSKEQVDAALLQTSSFSALQLLEVR